MDYKLNELFSVAEAADGFQLFHIIFDFDRENKTNTSDVFSLCQDATVPAVDAARLHVKEHKHCLSSQL